MSLNNYPSVTINEIDLSTYVPNISNTNAAFAGLFTWGPLNHRKLISSEKMLVDTFGKPDSDTYEYFFSAANYLSYSNRLTCVRVARETQTEVELVDKLTTTLDSSVISINSASHGYETGDLITVASVDDDVDGNLDGIPISEINGRHVITVIDDDNFTFTVTTTATAGAANTGGTFTVASGDSALNATAEKYTGSDVTGQGILIRNDDHYEVSFESGGGADGGVGAWAAKYPGVLGNSIKVSICPSKNAFSKELTGTLTSSGTALTGVGTSFDTELVEGTIIVHPTSGQEIKIASVTSSTAAVLNGTFNTELATDTVVAKWEYYKRVGVAPGTSDFARSKNCLNDEMHIVVVDAEGDFTGTPGGILEEFKFLSKHSTATLDSNDTNYYKDVINQQSAYIYWMDHISAGLNWGSSASGVTFTAVEVPYTVQLAGGKDGNELAGNTELLNGYDLFLSPTQVDISVIISGPADAVVQEYIAQSICEVRKDCVVTLSPPKAAVVNNAGSEVDDILEHFSTISNSSRVFVDDQWGLQFDRYNRVNRWVPCNGHTAGCMARIDASRDPWHSPAGTEAGHIKNVTKLAWDSSDGNILSTLYPQGINSIYTKPGQGHVLMGDKTFLNRPSAFGNINVRRLFIVLQKSISKASEDFLFKLNTPSTRARYVSVVRPFLREVKAKEGLTDFLVICDDSNNPGSSIDRQELRVDIYLKPTRVINYIGLNFIAVATGSEFNEVILGKTLPASFVN